MSKGIIDYFFKSEMIASEAHITHNIDKIVTLYLIFKGMFSEGLMHGRGTYSWADGMKYEVSAITAEA